MSFGARLDKMLIAWKPRIDISTKDRTNTAHHSKYSGFLNIFISENFNKY